MSGQEAVTVTKKVSDSIQKAEQALEASDVKELHALFMAARRDHAELLQAFDGIINHYVGSSKEPRIHSGDMISAMRDVAIAAIELAKASIDK